MAVFDDDAAAVRQLGFMPAALPRQPCIRVRRRLVRIVASFLAVEIYRRIARIVLRFLAAAIFSLKALLTRPRLDQGSIYAEVLIREQIGCTCLVQYFDEEPLRDVARQQPVAVLAVYRGHP